MLVVLLVALGAGVAISRGGDHDQVAPSKPAPCVVGAQWHQKVAPFPDGTAVGVAALNEVSVIEGGARIGFPSAAEFAAMGLSAYRPISASQYSALDLAPRDGSLFRERSFDGGTGRLYYATGGAVFQIRTEQALHALRLDEASAIVIPSHGLDGAPRVPQSGTLLRLNGSRRTWAVKEDHRELVKHVCNDTRINTLPDDRQVLDDIPLAAPSPTSP